MSRYASQLLHSADGFSQGFFQAKKFIILLVFQYYDFTIWPELSSYPISESRGGGVKTIICRDELKPKIRWKLFSV